MVYKWKCEQCGWEGDKPTQAYEESKMEVIRPVLMVVYVKKTGNLYL